jgi:hypothetical protein
MCSLHVDSCRYQSSVKSFDVSYMPVAPPIGDGLNVSASAWLESVLASPGLVASTVQPIWSLLTPALFPSCSPDRLTAQAAALQAYIEGGFCKQLQCPNPANSSYSELAGTMPRGRADGPGVVLTSGQAFLFGGTEDAGGTLVDNNYSSFEIDLQSADGSIPLNSPWSILSAGPIGAGGWASGCGVGAAAGESSGQVFIVGQCGTHLYDPELRQWSEGVPASAKRSRLGLAGAPGFSPLTQATTNVFAVGGATYDATGTAVPTDLVEVYSTHGGVGWHTAQPLTVARHSFGITVVDGSIWVVGGLGAGNVVLDSIEVYNVSANKWTLLSDVVPGLAIPR